MKEIAALFHCCARHWTYEGLCGVIEWQKQAPFGLTKRDIIKKYYPRALVEPPQDYVRNLTV